MLDYLAARFCERGSIAAIIMAITAIVVSALFVFVGGGQFALGVTVAAISTTFAVLVLLIPEAEQVMDAAYEDIMDEFNQLHDHFDELVEDFEQEVGIEPTPVVAPAPVAAPVVAPVPAVAPVVPAEPVAAPVPVAEPVPVPAVA